MATAANLRAQIEATLANRVHAAFSLKIKQSPTLFSTCVADVDAILEGGIPRGSITEISGAASTGKTSLAISVISGITQSGAACAWVDVCDALSPESAAASGIVLERLLWLRIKRNGVEQPVFAPPLTASLSAKPHRHVADQCGGSQHPRSEVQGMDRAVSLLFKGEGGLLRDKTIGTPGRSNRPMSEPRCAEPLSREQRNEQVAYDRLPARRGERLLKELAVRKLSEARQYGSAPSKPQRPSQKPWSRLEQALKATDLLLQTGGFAAIVLDMSDVLPQQTMRIPLATWYRFRLAAEQARTALILLTQSPCASSCAALVLRCESAHAEAWSVKGETPLFEDQRYRVIRERNRNESSACVQKKPPARADWQAQTEWTRVR
jgi:recombination protein RecA